MNRIYLGRTGMGMTSETALGDGFEQIDVTFGARLYRGLLALRAPSGVLLAIIAIWYGWTGRETRDISAAEGLGYWLGIIGGTLMLALLLYSVRKRIPLLRHLGATRHWFRMHMTLGIVGPVIILYHSNFQLGSLNSQVALFCTLLVAASGIVGRYFYIHIHNGLYGSKASLRELVAAVENAQQSSATTVLSRDVQIQLAGLADTVLHRPETFGGSAFAPVRLGLQTRWLYWSLKRAAYRHIDKVAVSSEVIKQQRSRLRRTASVYIARRLGEIRRVAQFGFFEKLFSLWHVIHVPFFLMMILSAILHVLAVHMY
jgi:hypothetical protein